MLTPSKIVAMSSDEVQLELKTIQECWDKLNRLSHKSRDRVISWLEQWARAERSNREDDF